METYPLFLSVMRKGAFWNYLEQSDLHPVVREEYKEPCSRLYFKDKKTLLFEVTYYRRRINFEAFHVLTDGTGATAFLWELVKNYLYLAHKEEGLEEVKALLEELLRENKIYIERVIPYAKAGIIQLIRKQGELISEEYVAEGIAIKAYVPMEIYGKMDD